MKSPDAYDENELLWEVGRTIADEGSAVIPDQALVAYREGRMEDTETLELNLAGSAPARARLAQLAACATAPPPQVRAAVLAGFDAAFRRPEIEPARGPVSGSFLKAAAVAAVGLGMLLLMRLQFAPSAPEPLPDDLAFDVAAEGLATLRKSAPVGSEVDAYPETRIRITASPQAAAVKDVEFGVYRSAAEGLERLGSGVEIETIRGAARVSAEARELLAPGAKSTRLFLVAARPGDLPAHVELAGAAPLDALEQAGRRRAYPLVIHLRPRPVAH